jgi:glycosyltransferase involved in cell wall biosynthesis
LKILFYNHTAQVSGAERVLAMILTRMNREQFNPVVVCPAGPMADLANSLDVPCETVAPLTARFTWRADLVLRYVASFARVIREVRNRVVKIQPDIIHANSIRAGLVMTFATAGLDVPVVWHAHDILPRHPFSFAIRLVTFLSARTHVLAVSQAVANRFNPSFSRSAGTGNPVNVVRNAVDLTRFRQSPEDREAIRKEFGLNDPQPLVGIVGQLTQRKGQLGVIHAFAQVLKQFPDAALLIVGEPLFNHDHDYKQSLAEATSALGIYERISFTGARKDISAVMQSLDVLVVNSWEEPFALVVLEGLASEIAVVATAVGGTPEMITHRENGWLVPARNDHALAEGIATLLGDPRLRQNLAKAGRREVTAHYSAERYIRDIHNFYRQILNVRTDVAVPRAHEVGERA